MEKILIQSVTLLNPQSNCHKTINDVLIVDGRIAQIDKEIAVADDYVAINAKGQYLSPGFFDLNVNFGEPGFETKEDIVSGCYAAAAGGFTGLALMPNTRLPIHSKAEILYILNKAAQNLVQVYPLGSISQNREGIDMAELYDMHQAGAIAFTDGNRPIADACLMSRCLLYTKGFDGMVFSYAEDAAIAGKGKMNEGAMSTLLGMKGNPALAEELMIARDISLAKYHDTKIHFSTISTAGSVELIRQAKKRKLKVTCDAAVHHLVFSENNLETFDSNYKVKPPLRTNADCKALLAGLKDGTIDTLVSQHTPHEIEFKNVEFELASYGMIGLQTALPMAIKAGLTPEEIIIKMSVNPRKILNLPVPIIAENESADLVIFNPEAKWIFNEKTSFSKSSNSPLMGETLKGKVSVVFNKGKYSRFN